MQIEARVNRLIFLTALQDSLCCSLAMILRHDETALGSLLPCRSGENLKMELGRTDGGVGFSHGILKNTFLWHEDMHFRRTDIKSGNLQHWVFQRHGEMFHFRSCRFQSYGTLFVSLMPKPQPGEPGHPFSLCSNFMKTCLARKDLPVAKLLPT